MELIRTKKQTCIGCRASEGSYNCSLGFKCFDFKPEENCPKPKTYEQLINPKNHKDYGDVSPTKIN